jgi:CHAD domain-containing protein
VSKAWPVGGIDPDASVLQNARKIIAVRFDELFSHATWMTDPNEVEQLHAARISAKRLRYTLELFAPVFGDQAAAANKQLAELQDALGAVHDLDVQIGMMEDALAGHESEQGATGISNGLRSLIRTQQMIRSRQYREAQYAWNGIDLPSMRDQLLK